MKWKLYNRNIIKLFRLYLFKDNRFNASLDLLKKCDDATFNNIISLNKIDIKSYKKLFDNEKENKISDNK